MTDAVSRKVMREQEDVWFFPAKHYIASPESRTLAFDNIKKELDEQLAYFEKHGKVVEHERLRRRVVNDLELIKNIGYCNGIENYSRHFDGRVTGEPPFTLLDYFSASAYAGDSVSGVLIPSPPAPSPSNFSLSPSFLTVIDESHVTIPQIRGMYLGDRARKDTLVEFGFRLPSARDNRPLMFDEFEARTGQTIYVSATPNDYERRESQQIVEQIVRPTGLVDPEVIIMPVTGLIKNKSVISNQKSDEKRLPITDYRLPITDSQLSQVEDVTQRIEDRIVKNERTLVSTLTKKMAEDLTEYLTNKKIKVQYLHSDIQTLERIEIITRLRKGEIDVIVGVNLLREGLDIPEVSLVAILDADKEGFLRSETSLIQTIGRAARNVNGQVVLYADQMTGSIERALGETARRREIQLAYNKEHGITPKTIQKHITDFFSYVRNTKSYEITKGKSLRKGDRVAITDLDIIGDSRPLKVIIKEKGKQMKEAAANLEFEVAAILRDEIRELNARVRVGR